MTSPMASIGIPWPLLGWYSWIRPRPGSARPSTTAAPGCHMPPRSAARLGTSHKGRDQRLALQHVNYSQFGIFGMHCGILSLHSLPWGLNGNQCRGLGLSVPGLIWLTLYKMIDPGQDSDLCGRSLEFAPSSALLRRASTYLAVAPDLPLWLPMPAKDVEPLVCLGLSAHPTVPCPTAQQIFLDPGQHVGQSYQSLRNEAWTCLGENEMAHLISYKQRVEPNHNSHFYWASQSWSSLVTLVRQFTYFRHHNCISVSTVCVCA